MVCYKQPIYKLQKQQQNINNYDSARIMYTELKVAPRYLCVYLACDGFGVDNICSLACASLFNADDNIIIIIIVEVLILII